MKKRLFAALLIGVALEGGWYVFTPDGPIGYDEGVRLADRTAKAADALQHTSDDSSTLVYTPKYGDDQPIHVEFTPGAYCPNSSPDCQGTTVVVKVTKGRSGAGYALGRSVAVPHRLSVDKIEGPVTIGLEVHNNVVQVVSIR